MGIGCSIKVREDLIIIWIDPNIENEENSEYIKELKELKPTNFKKYKNVDKAIDYMRYLKFDETKIIVSGKLYTELIEKFKKNILDMCIAPKIKVFTRDIDGFLSNNKEYHYIKNKFYSFGGIALKFSDVKEFLKSDYDNVCEEKIESEKNKPDDAPLTFEYIDRKEKLLLPLFFKVLIDETPNNDMNKYTNMLYNTYSENSDKLKILLGSIKSVPDIPIEILSKYYARLYTLSSDFHGDLNKKLGLGQTEKYISFIKILYEGVKYKSLPLSNKNKLYRGSKISNDEINKIKNYKKKKIYGISMSIVFSRAFLSFSKDKSVAETFLELKNKDDNCSNVLYILEKDDKIGYNLSTHGDIENISCFQTEREVLFFPFSSFEVKDIDYITEKNRYEIKLLYLGKYLKDIEKDKKLVKKANNLPDSEFKKHLIEFGLIKKEKMKNMNTKLLYDEYVRYEKAVGEHKIQENLITGKINIESDDINKDIQIINSFENVKRIYKLKKEKDEGKYKNEKELKDSIIIKINEKNIGFSYSHKFKEKGIYKIDYIFQKDLTNANYFFYDCKNIISLDFSEFYSSNINNMQSMFFNCSSLKGLGLSNFDTENVISMNKMFSSCSSLINIDLSDLDTKSIKDMSQMFSGCSSLKKLDLSKFGTKSVKNMSEMFSGCISLTDINLSNLNTKKVNDFNNMFQGCSSLISLDVSNFINENATDMSNMFSGCGSLKNINMKNFITSNVTNMENMFYNCKSLTDLDLSSFDTKKVNNMCNMFSGCESLIKINISNFKTINVTNMCKMFSNCKSLKYLDLTNFDTPNLDNMSIMFYYCESLEKINLSNFDTSKVTNMNWVFSGCKSLKSLDLSNFNTDKVRNMSRMFAGCESLTNLDLSNFNTRNVIDMIDMFSSCKNLDKNNIITNDKKILNLIFS